MSDWWTDNWTSFGNNLSDLFQNIGKDFSNGWNSAAQGFGNWWNDFSGTTAQNQFAASEAEKAREFNSAEAQKQRDFEMMMSNTAHQREVSDLQKAGLNPALGLSGSGASTPSGSSATSSPAQAVASGNGGILSLISKAANVALAKGLEAKFTRSALRAADNHELVTAQVRHLAAEERSMSANSAHRDRVARYLRAMAASRVNDSFAENRNPEDDYRAALHAYDIF